jgi:1-deoxy-D-xylulose-5-phosphate synthase
MVALPIGKGEVRRHGSRQDNRRVAILAFGTMVGPSVLAAEALDATVANMRFVKPLDEALVRQLAKTHDVLVTVEEGCLQGGAGSACLECLADAGVSIPVLRLGLPDEFVEHGDPAVLLNLYGLDADGIRASILRFMDRVAAASTDSQATLPRDTVIAAREARLL